MIKQDYFEWMYKLMCGDRFSKNTSYKILFEHLHQHKFLYSIEKDENRAEDGVKLRHRYRDLFNIKEVDHKISGPCTVLEMLVAIAIRCEETIMDDPSMGDRTSQWFWRMINNLGLGGMTDDQFNEAQFNDIINRLLDREYEPDGRGGLFFVRDCEYDMRRIEIWTQLLYYLDSITD
ncbi:MAG: hypothetical protein J6B01_04490 [Ruminococcus sp.]|nr:hypothetical protein [Ruminococcus sp.]